MTQRAALTLKNKPHGRKLSQGAIEEALQRADFVMQSRQPGAAESLAAEILDTIPGEPRASLLLAHALLAQGRPIEAIEPFENVARRTNDPAIDTLLAQTLKQVGRSDDALKRLGRAIKRRPAHAPAFFELGQQLSNLGRFDEAIDTLKDGIQLVPSSSGLSVLLGYTYISHNNAADARACFLNVLEKTPGHVAALFGLARAMQQNGEYAAAVTTYRHALAIKPNDPAARIDLGTCLLETGQAEQALESFRAAARDTPQFYGQALFALTSAAKGRFWLRPSAAARAVCNT